MNAREFFYLVAEMRDTQKRYFETRDQRTLRAARKLENDVDREIRRAKDIEAQRQDMTQVYNQY